MKKVVFLNKWNACVFHVILAVDASEISYNLASRVCTTLAEARRVVEEWRQRHSVDEVRENSRVSLSDLLAGIEPTDFSPSQN